MTPEDLRKHCEQLGLPAAGVEYCVRVASSPPSRRVTGGGRSVVSKFQSQKMGVTIQAESHRHELALVYSLEHDPDVLAYWDQPESIKISYLSANGRLTSPTTTPDYLVIRRNDVFLVEVKPHEALPELAKSMPNRFVLGEDGIWHCPPAEKALEPYGIQYQIWTPSELSPVWLANIQVLADYFGEAEYEIPADLHSRVQDLVREEPGISYAEIRRRCTEISPDHLNFLLARESVYVDLTAAYLTQPEKVRFFETKVHAEALRILHGDLPLDIDLSHLDRHFKPGTLVAWNGCSYTVGNLADETVILLADGAPVDLNREAFVAGISSGAISPIKGRPAPVANPEAAERLRQASQRDLEIAILHYRWINDREAALAEKVSPRTLRDWAKKSKEGEIQYGHGLLGLLPRFHDQGNRSPRFSDQTLELVDKIIEEVYCTASRPNKTYAYQQLRLACEKQGFAVPSYPNFTKRIRKRDKFKMTLAREGKRVAHKYELIRPGETNDNHGRYPWDVVLVDHTLVDVELVCSETGVNLGRPWISIMLDGFSRRVLAYVVTFDSPSYRTLMVLIRRCVERHQRLPRTLSIDGGPDFRSVYFETLAAAYAVTLKRRPGGKPVYGTIIERTFGTVNTAFLHTLKGNTQNTKNIRQLTKGMNPKGHALWTLEALDDLLLEFLYVAYDHRPHGSLICSPAEKYAKGLEVSGAREHKAIAYDENFHLMTLPTTRKGTAKVQPGMGFKVFGSYYWCAEMRSKSVEGTSVEVRYDPENLGVAWARIEGLWIRCGYKGQVNLEGRTEKEIQIATKEWRRARQRIGPRQSNSMVEFSSWLSTAEANQKLHVQRARDRASQRIRQKGSGNTNEPRQPHFGEEATNSDLSITPADVQEIDTIPQRFVAEAVEIYEDF